MLEYLAFVLSLIKIKRVAASDYNLGLDVHCEDFVSLLYEAVRKQAKLNFQEGINITL